jgi:hypothetical protein
LRPWRLRGRDSQPTASQHDPSQAPQLGHRRGKRRVLAEVRQKPPPVGGGWRCQRSLDLSRGYFPRAVFFFGLGFLVLPDLPCAASFFGRFGDTGSLLPWLAVPGCLLVRIPSEAPARLAGPTLDNRLDVLRHRRPLPGDESESAARPILIGRTLCPETIGCAPLKLQFAANFGIRLRVAVRG